MKTHLDCVPCFVRQALGASKLVSADSRIHEQILRDILYYMSKVDFSQPAPVTGQYIHRRLRLLSESEDPYESMKKTQNDMAKRLLEEMREKIDSAADPMMMALKLSIASNVIDVATNGEVEESALRSIISEAIKEPLIGELGSFLRSLSEAQRILFITDNAGEIVFDRLLIEKIGPERITVAVRGLPVINDATIEDARAAGLNEIVQIVDTGCDLPGVIVEGSAAAFTKCFQNADLIIAKGQGNYETLSEHPEKIYFLLRVKCHVIAEDIGMPLGAHVVTRSRRATA